MGKKARAAARASGKKKGGNKKGTSSKHKTTSAAPDPLSLIKGRVPQIIATKNNTNKQNYHTLYTKYKLSTQRFVTYMRENVPEDIGGMKSVNFLLPAVDWMANNNHVIDPKILNDLKRCVRMRHRVAESVFGGGDKSHQHFLCLLVYCWTLMRTLPTGDVTTIKEEEEDQTDTNRFSIFNGEEDKENEEEDEDENIFPISVPRPEPMDTESLTFEELLKSDDRNDAIFFLLTLDELMTLVIAQYRVLVRNVGSNSRRGISDTAMMENLLDSSIAFNFALQSVQQLEMELQAQHSHLDTPCRLLATLALPELTVEVDSIVKRYSSKSCDRSDIITFLGDCIQCRFHNPSDSWNREGSIVNEFVAQYEIDTVGKLELEQLFQQVLLATNLELPNKADKGVERLRKIGEQRAGKPHPSHEWLAHMNYISGDRAIHHTVRMLQLFGGVIDNCSSDKLIQPNPKNKGMFGKHWTPGSRTNKLRDMDEMLMTTLLPNWANMCRHGIMSKVVLPREDELCPFFVQLKSYVNNPRKTVSWSFAFGVHAVLTSFLEVDAALPRIIDISKLVFDNYFQQAVNSTKLLLNEKSSNMKNSPAWKDNLTLVSFLQNFGLEVYDDLAIWNVLCGGTNFSILSFLGNIEGGCCMIDCQGQLRIVMYLYHGLIINGIIDEDDIPFLKTLYNGFKECKALWLGSLPKKGELVKQFWRSWGMGLAESKDMAEEAKNKFQGKRVPSGSLFSQGGKVRGRKMHPIDPEEISTSFRRVCGRDFSGAVDKYHTPEQKQRSRGMEQYNVAVRTNDTLDHLENEIQLYSVNFIPTAYYLEQFVCSISRILGWDNLTLPFMLEQKQDMRQGVAILFAQHVLGALDFANDPLNYTFINSPELVAAAPAPTITQGISSFLMGFFEKVPPQNVLWFQAVDSGGMEACTKIETI